MSKKLKKGLVRLIVCLALFAAGWILPEPYEYWIFLAAYILAAYDVLIKSVKNISHGEIFDENFLMAVASIGALALGDVSEAAAVMIFYQIGEWFQSYAVNRSRKSIAELMDIRPDVAYVQVGEEVQEMDPDLVQVGDVIVISPGQKVPLDGTVLQGESALDTSALTGESVPRYVKSGQEVISGCINQTGLLKVRVDKTFGQSTVSKILELVENASDAKAPAEQFITKFARYYTPAVCAMAAALAVIPSLMDGNWSVWVYRALTFLVISCPCALVISVPLSFFGGIGGASRKGILVKGSTYLESLTNTDILVFDKTGTITKGNFEVVNVISDNPDLLQLAASAESSSSHPIAQSICRAARDYVKPDSLQEIAGEGVIAQVQGKRVAAGNLRLMRREDVDVQSVQAAGYMTTVYCAIDGQYAGAIEIADEIKEDSKTALQLLKQMGIKRFVMLTGDMEQTARAVADQVGIEEYRAQLLPAQKAEIVEDLLKQGHVAFVGDGINDAPVLMRSDVGIAMGALGSDAAIEAADIVLMQDQLSQIVTAMKIAKKTMRIVKFNIAFAIAVKVLVLILGALGLAGMWAAVFADVGVAFLCILNAMRALTIKS
jgi:Cd2+/Zn2+-exporting ATPase